MLEEQERAMQGEEDDFFENDTRRNKKTGWFGRNKKKDFSSKLEKWEVCEVKNFKISKIIKDITGLGCSKFW